MKTIDLTGQKFGLWEVIGRGPNNKQGQAQWIVRCTCGSGIEKILKSIVLRNGHSQSCGCRKMDILIKRSTKHGHSSSTHRSGTYNAWAKIIARCNNSNHPRYADYGERGITVCDRWLDFKNFLEDMGERPSSKHSIDRFPNNNGNYEPGNCRWATLKEQGRNKRNNILLTYQNQTFTVAEWCEKLNLPEKHIRARLKLGWSHEDILSIPIGTKKDNVHCRKLTKDNKTQTVAAWAKELNISPFVIYQRLYRGANDEQALLC